jgi:hypothetical protein
MPSVDLPGIPAEATGESLLSKAMSYLQFRRGREKLARTEDALKKDVMGLLAEAGEVDEKGSRYFYAPLEEGVSGIKRERRVSQVLDEDAAMILVEKYQLQSKCLETITVLNEDGLLAANFDGTIPDEEMKGLYTDKETFALVLLKD